jgi:hypothetical protein
MRLLTIRQYPRASKQTPRNEKADEPLEARSTRRTAGSGEEGVTQTTRVRIVELEEEGDPKHAMLLTWTWTQTHSLEKTPVRHHRIRPERRQRTDLASRGSNEEHWERIHYIHSL